MPGKPKAASASRTPAEGETSASRGPSSPAILQQALQWQQKSQQQASDTEQKLKLEFERFGSAVRKRLLFEQKKTETAIADHCKKSRQNLLSARRSSFLVGVLALVCLLSGAALTWFLMSGGSNWQVCLDAEVLQDGVTVICRVR